ncbi:unnamed protein product [Allacma fusca]|uniref:NEDD8 ultimate buster 1 n=1 Tax=Allacma fusca TaxID=39272 RepID=A0A8J2PUJ2_9HEXA|nr:unnamed protein product [Allacma fusca]
MSSKCNLAESALQARIRDKLNAENVKLWLEPFFDSANGIGNDVEILALASRYAAEFGHLEDEVAECLYSLQRNALERLAERDLFKETGLSTIRLKLSGFPSSAPSPGNDATRLQINLSSMNGKDLKVEIARTIDMSENQLKLISHGKVIDENKILELQDIRNGAQVMVLFLPVTQESYKDSEDSLRQLEETKDSANYLAGYSYGDNMYSLQVADQSGKALDLPESEKRSLAVALALHDKGRSALKSQDFSRALIFLLEADGIYNQCQSALLERVDNYGILNLDIAWCYLSLKCIAELPSVEARLHKSEKSLHRSYGENLERVVALKGSTGWEAALFVRLHLLQGIAAYHLGHIERSKFLLAKVDEEVKRLQVSDDQLAELINMGYGSDESRVALRAAYGNVAAAVDLIIRRREEEAKNRQQEKDDSKRRKLQKKLGECSNGDPVNIQLWRSIKEMGFNAMIAAAALKRTNNEINAALQLVNDIDFMTEVVSKASRKHLPSTTQDAQESSSTSDAVPSTSGSQSGGAPDIPNELDILTALAHLENSLLAESPSDEHLTPEDAARSQKAYDVLSKDISAEADYIDLTLSAENSYINQYKELLQM